MGQKYWNGGRIFSNAASICLAAAFILALGGACSAGDSSAGNGTVAPETTVPLPEPLSGKLLLYLVPSPSGSGGLSRVNTDLTAPALVRIPLIFQTPERAYLDLLKYVWTDASITFSGTGFSGAWPEDAKSRLVIQLNGPIKNANYSSCFAIRINGEDESRACSSGFSSFEFVPGGYTASIGFSPPARLETADKVEISFILGTTFGEGETPVPNLVYGGDTLVKTSFIEIGGGT